MFLGNQAGDDEGAGGGELVSSVGYGTSGGYLLLMWVRYFLE